MTSVKALNLLALAVIFVTACLFVAVICQHRTEPAVVSDQDQAENLAHRLRAKQLAGDALTAEETEFLAIHSRLAKRAR